MKRKVMFLAMAILAMAFFAVPAVTAMENPHIEGDELVWSVKFTQIAKKGGGDIRKDWGNFVFFPHLSLQGHDRNNKDALTQMESSTGEVVFRCPNPRKKSEPYRVRIYYRAYHKNSGEWYFAAPPTRAQGNQYMVAQKSGAQVDYSAEVDWDKLGEEFWIMPDNTIQLVENGAPWHKLGYARGQ